MIKTQLDAEALRELDSYLAILEDEVESIILERLGQDQKATEAKVKVDPRFVEPATVLLKDTLRYGIIINQDELEKHTNDNSGAHNEVKIELTIHW